MLVACAGLPPQQALPSSAKEKITSTDVVMSVRQNEIYMYVPPSNVGAAAGASFGLVGAIMGAVIDSSVNNARTTAAEKAMKPLRDTLVGFEYDPMQRDDLKATLSGVAWLHSGDVRVNKDFGAESYENAYKAATASTVLLTGSDYHLSNDGDVLYVTLSAYIFTKDAAAKEQKVVPGNRTKPKPNTAPEKSIYRDVLTFQTRIPGAGADRDKNIALWAADNGAAMRSVLTMASAKLAKLLADDLDRPVKDVAGTGKKVTVEGVKGEVMSTDADGSLVRLEGGTLKYVTNTIVLK
jgi:hypothetical protein